jgi:hypothetical protein
MLDSPLCARSSGRIERRSTEPKAAWIAAIRSSFTPPRASLEEMEIFRAPAGGRRAGLGIGRVELDYDALVRFRRGASDGSARIGSTTSRPTAKFSSSSESLGRCPPRVCRAGDDLTKHLSSSSRSTGRAADQKRFACVARSAAGHCRARTALVVLAIYQRSNFGVSAGVRESRRQVTTLPCCHAHNAHLRPQTQLRHAHNMPCPSSVPCQLSCTRSPAAFRSDSAVARASLPGHRCG